MAATGIVGPCNAPSTDRGKKRTAQDVSRPLDLHSQTPLLSATLNKGVFQTTIMPDDSSRRPAEGGGLWSGLRHLLFGEDAEPTLRDQIFEAIEDHRDDPASARDLSPVERTMLQNLLDFGDRTVRDVAVPRGDIVAIEEDESFEALVALFAEAGHSRMPVYRDTLDTVTGMIHVKDVFAILAGIAERPATISALIREPRYVPESMGVIDLLAEMRATQTHLAIVVDEYSGTEGLVTIEDLVEEIVGEIEDEHDEAPAELLVPLDGGLWEADARAELDDVAEAIDPRLAETDEPVDTLGGLAALIADRIPQVGDVLEHDSGWKLEVTDGDQRRVTRLRLHPPVAEPVADD
jgi:magnesium and cobalt transporter